MAEIERTDSQAIALSGTDVGPGLIPIPPVTDGDCLASANRAFAKIAELLRADFQVFKDGDLTFGVRPGKFFDGGGLVEYAGATAQVLTNNATNYIYLTAAGTLTVNTTGFPLQSATLHIRLAVITTDAGGYDLADIVDHRGSAYISVPSTMTAANAGTLVGGGVADSLHIHDTDGIVDGAITAAKVANGAFAGDTTPQLGGDLDVNSKKITSASDGDVVIEPNGTGKVVRTAGTNGRVLHYALNGSTTNATTTELTSPGRLGLVDETTLACIVTIVARQDTGANSAMYQRRVLIQRTGGTVALIGSVQTIGTDIETDAAWNVALSADDTNKSLKIEVTGGAAQNVNWVATIEAIEVWNSDA